MAITVNWNVTKLDVFAETHSKENVVCNIHLAVTATDGKNTAEKTLVVGVAHDETSDYVPYEGLTHDMVLKWAKDKLSSDVGKFENEVIQTLENNNVTQTPLDLPWL